MDYYTLEWTNLKWLNLLYFSLLYLSFHVFEVLLLLDCWSNQIETNRIESNLICLFLDFGAFAMHFLLAICCHFIQNLWIVNSWMCFKMKFNQNALKSNERIKAIFEFWWTWYLFFCPKGIKQNIVICSIFR